MAFPLTEQQRAAVEDRGGSLLVSAAAGSGKTRVLVERLLGRVQNEGVDLDHFLVITYTKASAAELRARIVKELSARLAEEPTNRHLRRQTTLIYKTQISTIHAFCAQILREHGHLLDLNPDFRLLDDSEASVLMGYAMDEVLEQRYADIDPQDDFAQVLDMLSGGRDDRRLVEVVLDIYARVQSHPDATAWMEEQKTSFDVGDDVPLEETVWGKYLLERVKAQVIYWKIQMQYLADQALQDPQLNKAYYPSLEVTVRGMEALAISNRLGWELTAQILKQVEFPRFSSIKNCENPELQARIKKVRELCKKRITKLIEIFSDGNEAGRADLQMAAPGVRGLFDLVLDFSKTYQKWKHSRSVVDFSDLEHMAVKLLVTPEGEPTPLAEQIAQRYTEIMVDEYQDTNVVQNAIFTAVSQQEENLFMVGDVKQSIYRFRLADPTIFLGKYHSFKPQEDALFGAPRRILLSQNFRSRPSVLNGVNFMFRNLMSKEFGEMDYTQDEALNVGATFPGDESNYKVELDVLDLPLQLEIGDKDKNQLEAQFIARRIGALLKEGFLISDGHGGLRPVTAGDIAILLRSPGPLLPTYTQALEEEDIPWQADGSGDFLSSTEVSVALSYLQIIDNPSQDIPLISVLRSPLWGFSPDRLAQIRAGQRGESFYTALCRDESQDSRDFLESLNRLRDRAPQISCHQLLGELYEEMHCFPLFAALGQADTRRNNLLAFSECAKNFEGSGHKGLFGFLAYLDRVRNSGGKFTVSQPKEAGGVQILSIHRSKGLEFPVVILGGLTRRLNRTDLQKPVLFHPKLGIGPKGLDTERLISYPTVARQAVATQLEAEMMAEELRLLYVAMTRAQEKLIMVCGLSRGVKDLMSLGDVATAPVEPQVLMSAQSVGQWVLLAALTRPDATELQEELENKPALCIPEQGDSWDIHWEFDLSIKDTEQASQDDDDQETPPELIEADPALVARLAWQYPHSETVDIPSKLTATQLKGRHLDNEIEEQAPRPPRPIAFDRPSFLSDTQALTPAQRGTALHLVMQFIEFEGMDQVGNVQREIDRLVDQAILEPRQGKAVPPEKISAFFQSDLGKTMMTSGTLQREFKFSILVPARDYYPQAGSEEEVLLQGVVDCWFETHEGITILDFKTDRVGVESLKKRAQTYAPQLDSYARALAEVTGKPVAHKVLWFFAQNQPVEII